jgi:Restriction endonuclease AspBHI N-terminal
VRSFSFDELSSADLVVDATYESEATRKNVGSEPLGPLTGTGNQGGFRFSGRVSHPNLVVLYTTMSEPNWPDSIDEESGLFVYFGDNRKPGFELHNRRAGRGGNEILRRAFELAHAGPVGREEVPPFLVFSKGVRGRDAVFRGLAASGAMQLDAGADLVAIWKSKDGQRFQNYRSVFTLLDVPLIRRAWLLELQSGSKLGPNCPTAWRSWVTTGKPKPLLAERISRVRVRDQQLGGTEQLRSICRAVYEHFISDPARFEVFAADVVRLMDQNVTALDVTRPTRDGGRDGIGSYRIGMSQNYVTVGFAMEAKCHAPYAGLGVKVICAASLRRDCRGSASDHCLLRRRHRRTARRKGRRAHGRSDPSVALESLSVGPPIGIQVTTLAAPTSGVDIPWWRTGQTAETRFRPFEEG